MKLLRSLLARLGFRRKSLEELAQDQSAEQRFFQEREAKQQTTGREWHNP